VLGVLLSAAFHIGATVAFIAILGLVAALLYRALFDGHPRRAGSVLATAAFYAAGVGVGYVATPLVGFEYRPREPVLLQAKGAMTLSLESVPAAEPPASAPPIATSTSTPPPPASPMPTPGPTGPTPSPTAVPALAWTATGEMGTPRRDHAATLLSDGRVLLTGGASRDAEGDWLIAFAETYDPASRSWTRVGEPLTARFSHTETLLLDGGVLLVGGSDVEGVLGSAEIYDPRSAPDVPLGASISGQTVASVYPQRRVAVVAETYGSPTRTCCGLVLVGQ
jgi:hypothetical protein